MIQQNQSALFYAAVGLITLALSTGCSVEKTQSAKAPDLDVNMDPGRCLTR
jgi:hypothetical protein